MLKKKRELLHQKAIDLEELRAEQLETKQVIHSREQDFELARRRYQQQISNRALIEP